MPGISVGLLGVAGRLSGTVSPFRAEQGTSLDQGDGERQGSLACCSPGGRKESDATERLNNKKADNSFPGDASSKEPPANAGDIRDAGSISGLGRSPEGGHGNPLQYSCLENPLDKCTWRAIVHGVAKCWT